MAQASGFKSALCLGGAANLGPGFYTLALTLGGSFFVVRLPCAL